MAKEVFIATLFVILAQLARSQPGVISDRTLAFDCPWRPSSVDYPKHDLFAAGVHVHNMEQVVFRAKGKNDAHVLLKQRREDFTNDVIEIVLGGWWNTLSVIRDRQQGPAKATHKGSVLSANEYRTFWIEWERIYNCIKVGRGFIVGHDHILSWCGLKHDINYISASFGFGSGGWFQFLKTATELTYYSEYRGGPVNYPKHDPDDDGVNILPYNSVVFSTMGRNDAHVLLKRNRNDYNSNVIEVVLGGWTNSQSVIRDRQQGPHRAVFQEKGILSPTEDRYFWISWFHKCIQVGKGYSVGHNVIMNWCGLTHQVCFLSASYGYGSDGYFSFLRTAGAP